MCPGLPTRLALSVSCPDANPPRFSLGFRIRGVGSAVENITQKKRTPLNETQPLLTRDPSLGAYLSQREKKKKNIRSQQKKMQVYLVNVRKGFVP